MSGQPLETPGHPGALTLQWLFPERVFSEDFKQMMLATERWWLLIPRCVIFAALASAAPAADNAVQGAGEPPAGLSAADWADIRSAQAAVRQKEFVADTSFLTGIDPIEQQAYLKASNTEADDRFGFSVAVSGDMVVAGAPFEDSNATGVDGDQSNNSASIAGAAYVFVRSGGVWSQQAYLKASNTSAEDFFGGSVAVSGDTVVVGAPNEASSATGVDGNQNDNSAPVAGAVYVFVRNGDTWNQQAYLKASNTGANDRFGGSVAVSGDTVVVGARGEDSSATGVDGDQTNNSATFSGAAYVFERNGETWSQQAYIKASNTGAADLFGDSVRVTGDTVVVGAPQEDSNATSVDGDQTNNSASAAGATYVFVREGDTWNQQAYLKASNTSAQDFFGGSIAASVDTVTVGAAQEDSAATGVDGDQTNNDAINSGAAYVFVRNGEVWSQQAYVKASNTNAGDLFGRAVAGSGDNLVVGAVVEDSNATGVNGDEANNDAIDSGAAYFFVRNGGTWSQQAYLKASNTTAGDLFGLRSAVSGDTVVVYAEDEASNATGVDGDQSNNSAPGAGAVYVFALGASLLGDLNCDGVVSVGDIGGFVLTLTDPSGYGAAFPACDIDAGDINNDGAVSVSDIGPFVALLTGG